MEKQPNMPNNGMPDPKDPRNNKRRWISTVIYLIVFVLLGMWLFGGNKSQLAQQKDLSYTKFTSYIENNAVENLTVYDDNHSKAQIRKESYVLVFGDSNKGDEVKGEITAKIPSVEEFSQYMDKVNVLRRDQGLPVIDVTYAKSRDYWTFILVNILPFALIILFFVWMSRGVGNMAGGMFSVGRAKAQLFDKDKKDKVTFKDVAGLAGAKQEVEEIVAFLKNPKKYTDLGGKIPKGALLVGPPGTGKTLLAKAVAGEANVPFFSMSGSDFVEMFVGVGASRVRDLFRQAKEKAPAIIFIDEIDAIGRARGKNMMTSANDERESTLNQLLTEMDGFGTNSGVIILAATNRADVLDAALLRAGRFDRQIHVELPDLQERKEIFQVHLRPLKLDNTVDVDFLAKQTPGFSGADIANVCNEAALIAARNNAKRVGKQDFMNAVDRIVGGLERKTKIMTNEEKRSIAYHEAGHATISWLLRWGNPLVKVTIVPRGVALGAAWYLPEERQLINKEHIEDELCSLLGGRAAEQLFLNQTSTGALNDLERATKQAYAMVAYYGMSEELKDMSFYDSTGRYEYGFTKPYSDKTADTIDKEAAKIIADQMARARQVLEQNAAGHHAIAELLIEKEVITSEDVERILGARPWKSRGDEIMEANAATKPVKKSRKKALTTVCMLAIGMLCMAQQPVMLPIDSAVRVGHLDNGLTYYIRHNELPKQRCEFHIAQAVGAILEEDNQNGLAHFLEHMAFNGTEHFPGKGIVNYFESIGVNFGGNINAYTSLDETVYRLSDVPTYRSGIIDSALLVMHDWACGLMLEEDEIDAERGVIREEWRTRSQANRRMWAALNPLMYPGSQYAKRDVIGDTAVINNFAYDDLRAYYQKWYGADNQAIIVVGDINVDSIEAKIKALWSNVPARKNRGERPIYGIADNEAPIIAQVKDKEAQSCRVIVYYKQAPVSKEFRGTTADYVQKMAHQLICRMMDNRMQELAQKPDASFIGGGCGYYEIVKNRDAFAGVYVSKPGQEAKAYQDLVYQLEKMHRYGFTASELERAKTEVLTLCEKQYNERNATRNITFVQEYIRHYLDGEVIPGIAWEYKMMQKLLPLLTLEVINNEAIGLVTEKNVIVAMTAPESAILPSEEECRAVLEQSTQWEIEAPVDKPIRTRLVEKAPIAGWILSKEIDNTMGTSVWTLGNGIRVIIKPTDYKQDEIIMSAVSRGGTNTIRRSADLYAANMATTIVRMSGIGDFSRTELDKALTGKYVSVTPSLGLTYERLDGSSNVRDFETMLQLTYLYMTAPRRDEDAFRTTMSMMETQLKNKAANPKSAWRDSIRMISSDYSDRTIIYSLDNLCKVNLDAALGIYKQRFANPADFTFFFTGNIDPNDEQVQHLICRWLGGMKVSAKREKVIDRGVRVAPGQQLHYFERAMMTKTGSNYIQYTTYAIPYSLANSLRVGLLGDILDIRYLESIREREGGSYGVSTTSHLSRSPIAEARLVMAFDTDPDKQERLMQIIHEEVQTIADSGALATDLSKVQAYKLKSYKENLEKNSYWDSTILPQYYLYGINYLTDYEATVQAVTGEVIRQTAQQFIDAQNVMEVVMMPAAE